MQRRSIVWRLMCLGLAVPCSGQTPHVAAFADSDRTVILTDPPGAIIVVDAETLTTLSPVVARYHRHRVDGVALPLRIRALPVDSGGCPQFVRISPTEPSPDTVHFVMNHCPLTDQDIAGKIFRPDSVDEPPERLRGPMPETDFLMRSRKSGCVMVGVVIDTTGLPVTGSVEIVRASDPGFIPSAIKEVLGSVFRPARVYGRKVKVLVHMPVEYSMGGNDESLSQSCLKS